MNKQQEQSTVGRMEDDDSVSSNFYHEEEEEFLEEGATRSEKRDELDEIKKMAQRETTRVRVWKGILLVVLGVTAALVTAGTYRILEQEEEEDFETAYKLFSNTMKVALQDHYDSLRLAIKSCATGITGASVASRSEFPLVTVDDFEVLGESTRARSGIEFVTWGPYILPDLAFPMWVPYSLSHQYWTEISRATVLASSNDEFSPQLYLPGNITPAIFGINGPMFGPDQEFANPVWQMSPPPFQNYVINFDLHSVDVNQIRQRVMKQVNHGIWGKMTKDRFLLDTAVSNEIHEAYHRSLVEWNTSQANYSAIDNPHSFIYEPIYKTINDDSSEIVGHVTAYLAWDKFAVDLLPDGVNNITMVLRNTCGQTHTYDVRGTSAYYMGPEDFHDPSFDSFRVTADFYDFGDDELVQEIGQDEVCIYSFDIYPTSTFKEEYLTNLPVILAVVVLSTFLFVALSFFMYDWFVQSRNNKVVKTAASSNAIVNSMFPSQIRDQLLEQQKQEQEALIAEKKRKKKARPEDEFRMSGVHASPNVDGDGDTLAKSGGRQIADFYPETTIMFSDIVGFTAWSSVREPKQVFELLENVYAAFDEIAVKRRVFKVETVGDSYVAAVGLPEARKDHAVVMCRFARDCNYAMQKVVRRLELTLGPETGDLCMRFGLHSGPVTAGVLRGERTRFQLFGDTMNTASRMESTGKPNMIQISQDTAELLKAAGKASWITPREEMVQVKGKGMMITYWLSVSPSSGGHHDTSHDASSVEETSTSNDTTSTGSSNGEWLMGPTDGANFKSMNKTAKTTSGKNLRLVGWNLGVLCGYLKRIEAARRSQQSSVLPNAVGGNTLGKKPQGTVLDEVQDVITLPSFANLGDHSKVEAEGIVLADTVVNQAEGFLTAVASLYRSNPFHNFEHASHVTMAVVKLLSRVVNPKMNGVETNGNSAASILHDYTYGITSDALLQFACIFSAIIHDLDHPGVSNQTLVKEASSMAQVYSNGSIAEQNSFDVAWSLFMDDEFQAFRHAVCANDSELQHFRQIVVNVVMATDVMDKDLNSVRRKRWDQAFGSNTDQEEPQKTKIDRKATVVIEHLIQSADIAHTMQHWHIYKKWNEKLFIEMYEAFVSGRTDKDPASFWYQGELGFFDHYVIPLSKKLDSCGVFGITSSEYLSYAERNRQEWADRGKEIVEEYLEAAKRSAAKRANKH